MTLAPDSTFGHFKIISQLGAGGMGEVFLAQDSRLGRKVALKILPEKISSDSKREKNLRYEKNNSKSEISNPKSNAILLAT